MIQAQLALIQELQGEDFWRDVSAPMLENVRKRIRDLVKLIERRRRKVVYSDFEDQIGSAVPIESVNLRNAADFERFCDKARQFLRGHESEPPIRKLRHNLPLTTDDLEALERILLEAGIGSPEDLLRAREDSKGLDRFVRSLVGLDRGAAKNVLSAFLSGRSPGTRLRT